MRIASWFIVVPVFGGPACSHAIAQPVQPAKDRAPITAAFADWQTRQKAVKTARYVLSGTTEFLRPLSPDSPVAPAGDHVKPYQATVLIDMQTKWFRYESTAYIPIESGGYQKRSGIVTFDGVEKRQGQTREAAEANGGFDLLIAKKHRDGEQGGQLSSELWPILFANGAIPTVHQPADVERLPLTWSAEDFVAKGRHVLRGNACQVLRTEPFNGVSGISDEYWVRPDRLSAVVRHIYLTGGQPWSRLDIDWGETEIGWMPQKWTYALTVDSKNLNRLTTVKVDRFEVNPTVTDADFTIPAAPGMKQVIVAEQPPEGVRVQPGRVGHRTYRIADNGEWVEVDSQGWKRADDGREIPLASRWRWWPWAVGGLGVLFSGWAVYRRRGRRAASASHPSS